MLWILLSFAVLSTFAFYVYRKYYCHRLFKRLEIPGPEPHWLFGNSFQLLRKDRHLILAKWSAQFGPFFGYYLGTQPVLVVSSTEAVENVCVKQFSEFQGHSLSPIQPDTEIDLESPINHMLFARGERWKRLRTICNPAFSTGKLKSYADLISKSQHDLMELLETKAKLGKQFDIRECYQYLTLEVIGKAGFGLQFDAIKTLGKDNLLLQNIRSFFANGAEPTLFILLTFCLTEMRSFFKFVFFTELRLLIGFFAPLGNIIKVVGEIVQQRRSKEIRQNDVLQMMIDVVSPDNETVEDVEKKQIVGFKSLSERELIAQCVLLFGAGYETTSTSLGFASYLLAKNPEVQEKLAKEVQDHFFCGQDGKFPELDYETVMNQMPYLEWVCLETVRLYPVGMNVLSRFVMNETSLCGVRVPKSIEAIHIDTWTIHHDEALWGPVDTNKFYPERFSPEYSSNRPDSAFLSFGYGPRQCIGMRLALLEMKMTLANVMLRFRLVEPDDGYPGGELPISSMNGPLLPTIGVPVRLFMRN